MRIATWNVNSIGARLERVLAWLELNKPDVLALQELKCTDDAFPLMPIQALGYEVATLGTGRWNGVALLSRVGIEDVTRGLIGQPQYEEADEPRAIGATCGGVRVWSVYVPNGREPDHPHYSYKLEWFAALKATAAAELAQSPERPLTIIGDYNVAPTDADVWDIAKFENSTHVTPGERQALADVLSAGLVEVMPRALKGEPFTFWDYRQASFGRGWGMRIDLIYANQAFADAVSDAYIDREERKGKGASDHAPVVVDVDLP
ncbi:MAG TPA: exodeoxyribonuclease III [Actinobacteria bacterium]|nr:exodeoxyribonuclease III [Actinomycetota bacterium]